MVLMHMNGIVVSNQTTRYKINIAQRMIDSLKVNTFAAESVPSIAYAKTFQGSVCL